MNLLMVVKLVLRPGAESLLHICESDFIKTTTFHTRFNTEFNVTQFILKINKVFQWNFYRFSVILIITLEVLYGAF